MRDFKKRRGRTEELLRLGLGALGVVVLGVLAVAAAHGAWDMYGKLTQASEAQQGAQAQLAALEAQRAQVDSALGALSTERGVETQIRERYGVARPGEGQIDIVRQAPQATTTSAASASWPGRLVQALFAW